MTLFDLGISTAFRDRVGIPVGPGVWTLAWAWHLELETGDCWIVIEGSGEVVPQRRGRRGRSAR